MQRSALPKSRAEKGKAASATPAVTHEIIPGKYNDQDWNFMLDHDDGDDLISDIVEEISSTALSIIFEAYLQKQLIPYTVSQAKDAILQIIEWQFLTQDEGEKNFETEPGWIPDEEPEPAVTDCWAQGSVPKQKITPRMPSLVKVDEESPTQDKEEEAEIERENTAQEDPQKPPTPEEPKLTEDSVTSEESEEEVEEQKPAMKPDTEKRDVSSKKKRSYKPHTGRLPSGGFKHLMESLDETEMKMYQEQFEPQPKTPDPDMLQMPASCHSILKLQAGRPPGHREVLFDQQGNVISVYRLDPERLPSHKVRTGFRVVDPAVEAAQARLEAMRTGRHLTNSTKKSPRPPKGTKPTGTRAAGFSSKALPKSQTLVLGMSKNASKDANSLDVAPLPPPMIDTMELVPGVIVKEGDRIKKGPKLYARKMEVILGALHNNLKPVSRQPDLPTLTVAELLEHQTPVVKPLVDNTPIPPISAQSQYG